ncbi:MAG: hypothetical protein WCB12_19645 [Bryobacteraceae bacterium]
MPTPEPIRELRPHFNFWLLEKVLGGAVTATALVAVEYVRGHIDFVAILAVLAASIVGLIWIDRKNRPRIDSGASGQHAHGEHPLSIISARWGIGGDAYRDVTDVVRQHAKPDSIRLPASRDLFGNPYPKADKHVLQVAYSLTVIERWEVNVKEGDVLTLPEKRGEEQGTKGAERRKAHLDSLQDAKDKILDSGISEAEYNLYIKLGDDFKKLRLCDKLALKRICDAGITTSLALRLGLSADGFADPDKIVGQLIGAGFIEDNMGALRPKEPRWLGALLQDNPPC